MSDPERPQRARLSSDDQDIADPATDESRPDVGPTGQPVTLADDESDLVEHGRIGYGRYGRWTPIGLALLLILAILALGLASVLRDDDGDPVAKGPAPEFVLTLFDGTSFNLADQRGKVVVVNFWASWCGPCAREMPALQAVAANSGPDVVFVGVGAKLDKDEDAAAFVARFGITYPIGRDTAGDQRARGPVETAFGIPGYPATFIIAPDGNIDATFLGPLDVEILESSIEAART